MLHRAKFRRGLAPLPFLCSLTASAAENYDNCKGYVDSLPATINTSGTWCLRADLGTSMTSGVALTVGANNVTLDCNHFKIGGLAAGSATGTTGVYASDRFNVTVRNCNVRGFITGIYLDGGGGHLIERNSLDANTMGGIYVHGAGSTVRGNIVLDTGGSTNPNVGGGYGINARKNVDIIDNTIDGVVGPSVVGIQNLTNNATIVDNRVRGLAAYHGIEGPGSAHGIYSHASYRLVLRDNVLQGGLYQVGIHCPGDPAEFPVLADGNIVSGFETGIENCVSAGSNLVAP